MMISPSKKHTIPNALRNLSQAVKKTKETCGQDFVVYVYMNSQDLYINTRAYCYSNPDTAGNII